jgi:tetratricopeptide (TPR) repeat protein
MTRSTFGRLTGATLIVLALAAGTPALAFNTGGESGGSGGGGNAGGNDNAAYSASPTTKSATPTMSAIQADIKASSWTKAIADIRSYLKANPKSADGWNLLGYSYRNHGDLKLADSAYDRALKLNPNHVDALSYQGVLYVKLGEAAEARANLDKIAKVCGNTTCPQYVALAKAIG